MVFFGLIVLNDEEEKGLWGFVPIIMENAKLFNNFKDAMREMKEILNISLEKRLKDRQYIPEPTDFEGQDSFYPIEVDAEIAQRILERKKEVVHA